MSGPWNVPAPPPAAPEDKWTAKGRSPNSAALFALLGVMIFYAFTQVLFAVVGIVATAGDLEKLIAVVDALKEGEGFEPILGPIRWALLLSQYLGLLLPVLFLVRQWHTRDVRKYIRLRGTSVTTVLLAVAGTVLLMPVASAISDAFKNMFHVSGEYEGLANSLFTAHSFPEFLFLTLVVAVTPAICEEIFFRGYVQRTFERTMGMHAVPLVGMLFGLFHMQPAGLISLTLIGIWLGFVNARSRSLVPNMAAHFTNNFVVVLVAYLNPQLFGMDLMNDENIPVGVVAVCVPLLALVAWAIVRSTRRPAAALPLHTDSSPENPLP